MIYLDCTTVLRQDFVSGIQRVLIDFASENSEVIPVVWSFRKEKFEALSKFPKRQIHYKSPLKRILIITLLAPTIKIGIRLLYRHRRQIMRIEIFRRYANKIYSTIHVQESFGNWRKLISHEISSYSRSDTFILIDIPTSKRYKKNLIKFLESSNVQKVAYVHDLIPLEHPEFWSKLEYPKVREDFLEYLACIEHFDILVANSIFTSRRFENYFETRFASQMLQKNRIFKSVYPSSKLVEGSLSSAFRKNLDDSQVNTFLMVGNFDKRKNFVVVLKAFKEFDEPITLRIVSPSNLFLDSEVKEIMHELEKKENFQIQLFEQVPDTELSLLYSNSEFLLLPSLAEGFGIPVIEGLAHNCKVIVANNSSLSELANRFKLQTAISNSAPEWAKLIKIAISGNLPICTENFERELFMPRHFKENLLSIARAHQ